MTRPMELVRAYDARGAARKAVRERTYARRKRARKAKCGRVKLAPVKHRRGLLRLNAEVRALPADVREAYATASPAVRRLIREQARDDATVVVKGGADFDEVLRWKEA